MRPANKIRKNDRDSPYTGCHSNTPNPQTPAICKNWEQKKMRAPDALHFRGVERPLALDFVPSGRHSLPENPSPSARIPTPIGASNIFR